MVKRADVYPARGGEGGLARTAAKAENPKNFVNSVGKAFAVLRSFTADDVGLSITEIAARAGLDRGTAFRLVQTLVKLGYLNVNAATRRYRLSLKCLDL